MPAQLQHRYEQLQQLADGDLKQGSDLSTTLGQECLLDTFLALFDECQQDCLARNKNIAAFLKKCEQQFCL